MFLNLTSTDASFEWQRKHCQGPGHKDYDQPSCQRAWLQEPHDLRRAVGTSAGSVSFAEAGAFANPRDPDVSFPVCNGKTHERRKLETLESPDPVALNARLGKFVVCTYNGMVTVSGRVKIDVFGHSSLLLPAVLRFPGSGTLRFVPRISSFHSFFFSADLGYHGM
jgi:hypothetical protein